MKYTQKIKKLNKLIKIVVKKNISALKFFHLFRRSPWRRQKQH